ncbi:UMP kinase [Candidatus Woesearchaeota archaeon]|nr:UMP kinase [Candidatus Woesearchaeota archaeon]
MKKEVIVFSLGGSLVVPNNVDYNYLHKFKIFVNKLRKKYNIVLVTGGGKTARDYIKALRYEKADNKLQSIIGIMSTKLNARLVAGIFGLNEIVPDSLEDVKKHVEKNGFCVCGALGFQPDMTSDGDAAEISAYLKADLFVNLTNVDGLYDKDPKKYKTVKLIQCIDYKSFIDIVNKIKYESGQHFVLDQAAARIISKSKIKTLIVNGKKLDNVLMYLKDHKFRGTLIN